MTAVAQLRNLLLQPWFARAVDGDHAASLYDQAIDCYRRKRALDEARAEVNDIEWRLLEIDLERNRVRFCAKAGCNPIPLYVYVERVKLRKRLRYLKGVAGAKVLP